MKRIFIIGFTFLISLISYSSNLNIKIFSGENGYSLAPQQISLTDITGKSIQLINRQSAALPSGDYSLYVYSEGYQPSQTNFTINENDLNCNIYLDPVNKDPLLSSSRIKQTVKENYTLILGYITDINTGEPISSAIIKDEKSAVTTISNGRGYFEFFIPSSCEARTTADIIINKAGYILKEFRDFEISSKTDFIFTARLNKNTETNNKTPLPLAGNENFCESCNQNSPFTPPAYSGFVVPLNIRVGRNCTGTNCTTVEVYSLETYCKHVLPSEIYSCWGNLTGGMNSLQACAVAVRSYGVYFVYNPISASYDICDNTYCQYFGTVTSTNTNNAVDNTYRNILVNASGVVQSEYSAENNNKGCGNGYSGTGSAWPCIYDPVCLNNTPNGHGRGLCQWGTVRWATGTLVTVSSPCTLGAAHTYGTKTWAQILTHYYSVSPYNWSVFAGTTATINSSTCTPFSANPCSTITITSNVNATNAAIFMIGASIAPAGTTNWISDPPHDVKLSFSFGTGNYQRQFTVPCNVAPGYYDLLTAIWYDKNNNNLIDGADFVVHSKLTPNAINISPIGINIISTEIPKEFNLFQNYPNPFNPVTQIKFDVPASPNPSKGEERLISIIIYDITGRLIETMVNQNLAPGKYSVDWNANNLPSGVYFYTIHAGNFNATRKLVLLK
jgi:stage II sporulation SpoD-like protein/type IX secretion system substrate protein